MAAVALTGAVQWAHACDALVVSMPGVLGLSGCLTRDSVDSLLGHMKQGDTRPLVVQSPGGGVGPAIELATRLAALRTTLRIRGRCESSCANYLIAAAARVEVEAGARIAFHGDAELTLEWKPLGPELESARGDIEGVRSQERQFRTEQAKARLIHTLQRVALSPAGPVELESPRKMTCVGLGLALWSPELPLLQDLGLIHAIIPDDGLLAEHLPRLENPPLPSPSGGGDPRAACSPRWP